jgi:hypothetical protein
VENLNPITAASRARWARLVTLRREIAATPASDSNAATLAENYRSLSRLFESARLVDPAQPMTSAAIAGTPVIAVPRSACRWLGVATGIVHKRSCFAVADVPEHWCLHDSTTRTLRSGEQVAGRCTPTNCQDSVFVHTCSRCPLWSPALGQK